MQDASLLDAGVPLAVVAGAPGWWGGNNHVSLEYSTDGVPLVHRLGRAHRNDILPWDGGAAFAAALSAEGIGPRLIASGPQETVLEYLSGAKVGTHTRIRTREALGDVVGLHRLVGELDLELPIIEPVAETFRLVSKLAKLGGTLPSGAEPLVDLVSSIRACLADGPDPEVSAGDSSVTNLLFTEPGQIKMVGGSLACRVDPLFTAGILINEFAPFFGSAEEIFEQFAGSWDGHAYARARLFGIVDDVRWAAISRLATVRTTDRDFLSSVTGNLRIKHATALAHHPELDAWKSAA